MIVVKVFRRYHLLTVGPEVPADGGGLLRLRRGVGIRRCFLRSLRLKGRPLAVIGHSVGDDSRRGPRGQLARRRGDSVPVHRQMEGHPDTCVVKGRFSCVEHHAIGFRDGLRCPQPALRQRLQNILRHIRCQVQLPGGKCGIIRAVLRNGLESDLLRPFWVGRVVGGVPLQRHLAVLQGDGGVGPVGDGTPGVRTPPGRAGRHGVRPGADLLQEPGGTAI